MGAQAPFFSPMALVVYHTDHYVMTETKRLYLLWTPQGQIASALLKKLCTFEEAKNLVTKKTYDVLGKYYEPTKFPISDAFLIPHHVPMDYKPDWNEKLRNPWPFKSDKTKT
jgi:hypothetical protein